jgi:hypothetical protein
MSDKNLAAEMSADRQSKFPSADAPESSPGRPTPAKDAQAAQHRQGSLAPGEVGHEDQRQSTLTTLALPIEGALAASATVKPTEIVLKPMASVPSLKIEDAMPAPNAVGDAGPAKSIDEPVFVVGDPTADDRAKAQKIFDGNEDFIQKEKAAAWMGEEGPIRQRTLRAYMDLYDFANQNIVSSLRQVCGRLVFRAETQQVDRILLAFAKRWCGCNPNHGFKAAGE